MTTPPLVTQRHLEELMLKLRKLETRVGRVEVRERADYDFNSFTPTLVGAGTAGTFTYTANATLVEWTRRGNRVSFNGRIVITAVAVAPVGNMTINGWPYPGVSDANMAIAGDANMIAWRGLTLPAGFTQVAGQFVNGLSTMAIMRQGSGTNIVQVLGAEVGLVGGAIDLRFSGEYRIA